jgi:recombination protein RecT
VNQRQGQQRQPTQNEQISQQQNAQQALNQLMRDIAAKRRDIEAVLPADIKFEKFQACLNMAIRRDPKLLECHGPSLIRAAIMSAYDGLLPDGREAVIVYRSMSYKEPNGQWARGKRLEASYMPMAFGLRKKIVEAGAARHIKAVCVYQNDHFEWEEGLNERLEHKPFLADESDIKTPQADGPDQAPPPDPRGALIAVYSIAILPDGDKVFEVMPRREVMKVKAKAQTKDVWEGPFEAEMWRKSVLRRHAKALPSARPIRDAEAQIMFPEFSGAALPAPAGSRPAMPTRDQFAQLGAPDVELPLDLSGFGGDGELAGTEGRGSREQEQTEPKPKAARAKKGEASGKGDDHDDAAVQGGAAPAEEGSAAQDQGGDRAGAEPAETGPPALETPKDQAGWERWQAAVLAEIGRCKDPEILNRIQMRERDNTAAAPKAIRNRVEGSFTDMRVDLSEKGERDED